MSDASMHEDTPKWGPHENVPLHVYVPLYQTNVEENNILLHVTPTCNIGIDIGSYFSS